jgi:hypothetical protein
MEFCVKLFPVSGCETEIGKAILQGVRVSVEVAVHLLAASG